MPTAPLPLFQALLAALNIPLTPPSIPAIPPSLLLLTLERILGTRVPLPAHLRTCASQEDELELVKCLMGVMADDELGMDLTAVDPARVVRGYTDEMCVMIMALVVIAKRRGVVVYRPADDGDATFDSVRSGSGSEGSRTDRHEADRSRLYGSERMDDSGRWYGMDLIDVMDEESDYDAIAALREPLEPDVTLSSPVLPSTSTSTFASRDVFGEISIEGDKLNQAKSGLFGHGKMNGNDAAGRAFAQGSNGDGGDWTIDRYDPGEAYETPMPRNGLDMPLVRSAAEVGLPDIQPRGPAGGRGRVNTDYATSRDLRDAIAIDKVANWREDSGTIATTATSSTLVTDSSGHRTVLQEMMDEFGLG